MYLVDEEIYAKCPTVVISTVDKFAKLPWSEQTGLLFGRQIDAVLDMDIRLSVMRRNWWAKDIIKMQKMDWMHV